VYAPPEVQKIKGVRLRLHLLTWRHLQDCKELFADKSIRKRKRTERGTRASLCEEVCLILPQQQERNRTAKKSFNKTFSKLNLEQLQRLLQQLKSEDISSSTPTNSTHDVKVDTVMNLYLHAIVFHFPNTYEQLDFKNMSTERGEGFFAHLSNILLQCTGRDLQSEATLREVYIRLGLRTYHAMDTDEEEASNKRINKAFSGNYFA